MSALPPNVEKLRQKLGSSKSAKAAWKIIAEYFRCFNNKEVHEELWLLRTSALVTGTENPSDTDREDLFFFLDFTMLLVEAFHELYFLKDKKGLRE